MSAVEVLQTRARPESWVDKLNALTFRIGHRIRHDWRPMLVFALIVAAVGTTVLAFAAGAQRTSSAPDRYTQSLTSRPDATIWQESGLSRVGEIERLKSVKTVSSMTFMMARLMRPNVDSPLDGLVFAGSPAASDSALVSGREVDPTQASEFVASETFVKGAGAALGDTFQFLSLTAEQADRFGFDVADPQGPSFEATLVGIVGGTADGDPGQPKEPVVWFGPAVLDGVDIAVTRSVMAVTLRPQANLASLRADLDNLLAPGDFRTELIQPVNESIRTAVSAQASGLWVLTAVAAVACVVALGQYATRFTRLSDRERASLSALGLTSRQLVTESLVRVFLPVLLGALFAVGGAYAFSGFFPTGVAKPIEPHPGLRFDAFVLLIGTFAFSMAVVLWAWLALAGEQARSTAPKLSPIVEQMARISPTPAAATGLRFAFTRTRGDNGITKAAIWGLLFAASGIVGAITVASSLDRLVSDPPRHGNFDAVFGGTGQTVAPEEFQRGLEADTDVAGLTLLGTTQARSGDTSVELVGYKRLRGPEVLVSLEGRPPTSANEIALGRLTAKDLGVGVGDQLTLGGVTSSETFTVTGLVVMPSFVGGDGVGKDGLVTMDGLQRLDDTAVGIGLGVNLLPDAPDGTMQRIADQFGLEAQSVLRDVPFQIANLDRVRAVPYLLAVVLALLGLLTVAHTMFTSARNRRRDFAVLSALGADRPWAARVVHWQASMFVLLPVAVGGPLGLLVGREIFRWMADRIGAANDASFPFVFVLSVAVAFLVLANLAASLPARRLRSVALAQVLHPE